VLHTLFATHVTFSGIVSNVTYMERLHKLFCIMWLFQDNMQAIAFTILPSQRIYDYTM